MCLAVCTIKSGWVDIILSWLGVRKLPVGNSRSSPSSFWMKNVVQPAFSINMTRHPNLYPASCQNTEPS